MSLTNPDHDEVNKAMERVLPLLQAMMPRGWKFEINCNRSYDSLTFKGEAFPLTPKSVSERARLVLDQAARQLTETVNKLKSDLEDDIAEEVRKVF